MPRNVLQDLWPDTDLLFLDPPDMDAAIIGVCERFGQNPIVAYNRQVVIRILESNMSEEEAHEWFWFNTFGAWVGDDTPCFVTVQT